MKSQGLVMTAPTELVTLCGEVGREVPWHCQGAGGNVSIKQPDQLWIKASGVRLDQVASGSGFALVDSIGFKKRFAQMNKQLYPELAYAKALQDFALPLPIKARPSMETGFHLVLPGRIVLHCHSLSAILMAHFEERTPGRVKTWLEQNSNLKCEFTPPTQAGLELSDALARAPQADAYILQNHGLVLQGSDGQIFRRWLDIEARWIEEMGWLSRRAQLADLSLPELTKQLGPTPLKLYFPDAAVFVDSLRAQLSIENNLASWKGPLQERNRSLLEIWVAIQILYYLAPDLSELPMMISKTIALLPTEAIRRGEVL